MVSFGNRQHIHEAAVALWEFILSAGLGVIFQSGRFLDLGSNGYIAAVGIVRLFMLVIAFLTVKSHKRNENLSLRIIAGIAIADNFYSFPVNVGFILRDG